MTNRRMRNSDYLSDYEDDTIGLTSAFPATKGPQSVDYDKGDDAIGLTGAFAPIPEQNEPHAWDEAGKWKDFDWEAYKSEDADEADEAKEAEGQSAEDAPAGTEAGAASADTTSVSKGLSSAPAAAPAPSRGSSGRGRHAAPDVEMSPRMQKARKTRRALLVVVILLIIAIGVVVFFMYRTYSSSQEEATHQAQEQVEAPKEADIGDTLADDSGGAQAKQTDVPNLTSVLGMTADEAVKQIGHGAMALPAREVNEEGNPIKSSINVSLNDEPIDSKTGAPMVYLGLNQEGKVIQVGYSASASALGFGSLSFSDAVSNEHVIEKTLAKIGVDVPMGSAVLPADKNEYSTYASDGTTVTRERCSFEGDVDVNGTPCTWSSVLSYDYTTQLVTGDLSDTVRIIYVYLTKK